MKTTSVLATQESLQFDPSAFQLALKTFVLIGINSGMQAPCFR